MLDASRFRRKKMAEIGILDDEIRSRYETIHGYDGLNTVLPQLFNAMTELRIKADYGDYLAYSFPVSKGNNMNDMISKVQKIDWQAVAQRILKEESTVVNEKRRRLPLSPTPYLDDIAKAVGRLGCEATMIRYQIIAYADRNNFCHSGIKEMIAQGYLQELAERVIEDLRSLDTIFRDWLHEQIEMRRLVKVVEKERFVRNWVEETRRGRQVLYAPTEKGYQKMLSKTAAVPTQDEGEFWFRGSMRGRDDRDCWC